MIPKEKKCIVILQARTDSTRYPNKALSKLNGKPMLWHILERIKKMHYDIVVATTRRQIDNPIVNVAKDCNVKFFRGNVNDVLDRFYNTAIKFDAKIIVRMTADNPLVDPVVSKKVINKFLTGKFDYVTTDDPTFTTGLSTECFSFDVLKKIWKKAKSKYDREHVTPFIYKNPEQFKIGVVKCKDKRVKNYRLTVDYPDDLTFVKEVYSRLYRKNRVFLLADIISLLEKEPNLLKINSHHKIKRKVE